MTPLASFSKLPEGELDRLIKRIGLVLAVGALVFVGFYLFDRWRAPTPPIIDQRVVALEEAVRKNPEDIASRGQLADTYVRKGRFQDAVAQYDAILQTSKADEPAYFGRAAAYVGLNRLDDAAGDYLKVVEIAKGGEMANVDPTLEAAYYGLGSVAMKQNRPADAIPFLEKALNITRSDADALYLIGTAFVATGQTEKAITVLRASITFVPIGWAEPYSALADAYAKAGSPAMATWAKAMADLASGKPEAAEPALKGLTDGEAAVDAAVGLGLLYETRGDTASAATWYAKAVALQPDNNAALLGLSRVRPVPAVTPAGSPSASGGNG
jgi:tetratricopeptide (TPR) repeat protein